MTWTALEARCIAAYGAACLKAGREQGLEEAIRAVVELDDDPCEPPPARLIVDAIRALDAGT